MSGRPCGRWQRNHIHRDASEKEQLAVDTTLTLTVHGIGVAPRELAPGEDRTWVTTEQFESVLDHVVGRTDVRITFDDGNASDLEIGLPRLLDRNMTAEFFVLAGLLGEPGRLDAAGVRELVRAGMRVGSHGWAHRDWRRLNRRDIHEEYTMARKVLCDLTGKPVSRVAVPFGSYDRHVLRHLRDSGVTRVFTSDGGRTRPDRWLQPRNSLHSDLESEWLGKVVDGHPQIFKRARRNLALTAKRFRG